jgi:hypothetical protein
VKAMTHGFLALKAIERLKKAPLAANRDEANELVRWLHDHRDGVIPGAWYPDSVFKDMANSHVFKLVPDEGGVTARFCLPPGSLLYKAGCESPVHGKPFRIVDPRDNLPARCEAWAHSVIDHLKIQETEGKGSPVASTGNHVVLGLFILSHYVADALVPLHCDGRAFSSGGNLHDAVESAWEREVSRHFELDAANHRFRYDAEGYPLWKNTDHSGSFLVEVDAGLSTRPLSTAYGDGNSSVADYMRAICQYSYLIAYRFVPAQYNEKNLDMHNWQALPGSDLPFRQLSALVFSEAIDAIARIWLRLWLRYRAWKK